jgi:hypothetical protein
MSIPEQLKNPSRVDPEVLDNLVSTSVCTLSWTYIEYLQIIMYVHINTNMCISICIYTKLPLLRQLLNGIIVMIIGVKVSQEKRGGGSSGGIVMIMIIMFILTDLNEIVLKK